MPSISTPNTHFFASLVAVVGLSILVSHSATAQNYTLDTLVNFDRADGSGPVAGLISDSQGNFYGTTSEGGTYGGGTVFKISSSGVLTTLVSFDGAHGSEPYSALVMDSQGNLYGTTYSGGTSGVPGDGIVYKLSSSGVLTTIANFDGTNGAHPWGNLVMDSQGNLYGITNDFGTGGHGTVFKVSSSGVLTTLVDFSTSNLRYPTGNLAIDSQGNLYGVTTLGGTNGAGAVFEVTSSGELTTLVNLSYANEFLPTGVIVDSSGNLYGTTEGGGTGGAGTVFEFSSSGVLTILANFNGNNGASPQGNLLMDSQGNLYGVTGYGGTGGAPGGGTVFELSSSGVLSTLANLTDNTAASPTDGLAIDSQGNLYGTTEYGGTNNQGTVFKLEVGTSANSTPEPDALALWGAGVTAFGFLTRKRRRK